MKPATMKAIEVAGGPTALAKMLCITRQAVEQWDAVPSKHVLAVEHVTGVSRYELRPDLYGPAPVPLGRKKKADLQPAA